MIHDYNLLRKSLTSSRKEREFINVILHLETFSEKARRDGYLSLEADINEIKIPFLKLGIHMIVDGVSKDIINDILLTRIYFSHCRGKNLLKMLLIYEGILSIRAGDNPRILLEKLFSQTRSLDFSLFNDNENIHKDEPDTPEIIKLRRITKKYQQLTEEYQEKLRELVNKKKQEDFDAIINEIKTKSEQDYSSVSDILDTLVKDLRIGELEELIEEIHLFNPSKKYTTLANALRGCSKATVLKVMKCLNVENDWMFISYYTHADSVEEKEIISAQKEIKATYEKLKSNTGWEPDTIEDRFRKEMEEKEKTDDL